MLLLLALCSQCLDGGGLLDYFALVWLNFFWLLLLLYFRHLWDGQGSRR